MSSFYPIGIFVIPFGLLVGILGGAVFRWIKRADGPDDGLLPQPTKTVAAASTPAIIVGREVI